MGLGDIDPELEEKLGDGDTTEDSAPETEEMEIKLIITVNRDVDMDEYDSKMDYAETLAARYTGILHSKVGRVLKVEPAEEVQEQ